MHITSRDIAAGLGVDERTVRRWKSDHGMPVSEESTNLHDLWQFIHWYAEHCVNKATPRHIDFEEQKARKTKLEADRIEIELLEKKGQLIPIEVQARYQADLQVVRKNSLAGLPTQHADKLARITDPGKVQLYLEVVTAEIINEEADAVLKLGDQDTTAVTVTDDSEGGETSSKADD